MEQLLEQNKKTDRSIYMTLELIKRIASDVYIKNILGNTKLRDMAEETVIVESYDEGVEEERLLAIEEQLFQVESGESNRSVNTRDRNVVYYPRRYVSRRGFIERRNG